MLLLALVNRGRRQRHTNESITIPGAPQSVDAQQSAYRTAQRNRQFAIDTHLDGTLDGEILVRRVKSNPSTEPGPI